MQTCAYAGSKASATLETDVQAAARGEAGKALLRARWQSHLLKELALLLRS